MESPDNASEQFSTSAELRSYIEGNLGENTDVYPHAGFISDSSVLELMNFLSYAYDGDKDGMPYNFENTDLGQMMKKSQATKTATKAVREGNISQMKYVSGKQSYQIDASSINALIALREKLENPAYIQYLFGHMGNGKTDFAILECELAKRELGFEIGSNIKSFTEKDKMIQNYGELLKWLANGQQVSSVDEIIEKDIDVSDKLFVFDEASSHASGYSDDAYETQKKLGVMVKKIRKVGGRLIVIGHTGKDIHPDIRRLSECVHKTGKKVAKIYQTVDERGNGEGLKDSISGIPKTNWNNYETKEITKWNWSDVPQEIKNETGEEVVNNNVQEEVSKEQRNIDIAKAIVSGNHPEIDSNKNGEITQEMLADHYELTRPRISQILKDIKETNE